MARKQHIIPRNDPRIGEPVTANTPVGTRVVNAGYGYLGEIYRFERKHRTDWAVVMWDGAPYTEREYPSSLNVWNGD